MRKPKNKNCSLIPDVALVATITLINRFMETRDQPMVKRDGDEKKLNRKLTVVSLVYHALGLFYNE